MAKAVRRQRAVAIDQRVFKPLSCSHRVLQHAFDITTNSSVAVRATARRNRHSGLQHRYDSR